MPFSFPGQNREGIVVGVTGMDHHGKTELAGDADLRDERLVLRFGAGVVAVVVQSAFTDGHHLGVLCQAADPLLIAPAETVGVVGVDTDGGVDDVEGVGELDGLFA